MAYAQRWTLGAKLALIGVPFLLLALLSTSATLWVAWQLDGGAAAVNEAGRMRMQTYRLALSIRNGQSELLPNQIGEFNHSLTVLRHGDPERPLFMPWDDAVKARFAKVEINWEQFQTQWMQRTRTAEESQELSRQAAGFVADIDALVSAIEAHMASWTATLHLLQVAIMGIALISAAIVLYTGTVFVLEPVSQLKQAIEKLQGGDFNARVQIDSSDELGTLARGFNVLAQQMQSMYRNLERKVSEKTRELTDKHERLESLYAVTALVSQAATLEELAQGFTHNVARIARADGIALRWSDQARQRYLMLASEGLPASLVEEEQCIHADQCLCADSSANGSLRVIPIQRLHNEPPRQCEKAGFGSIIAIPIRLHERLMGEVDLFFHARVSPSPAERALLEALTSHLASAMENLRLNALEKEAAVSQERNLLARELHDSIAQSLAFLKIQVQFMRDALKSGNTQDTALALEEIDTGVRESYGDVRELLMHFRTRASAEDIEPALATTLRKFEHQSGIQTELEIQGHGLPLPADVQIQVLHIVQEALSNVRKHAQASRVWLDVQQQPQWRFEVRDNGRGFDHDEQQPDETHVGLGIMRERAQRIHARVDVLSTPGRGTSVVLTLEPALAAPAQAAAEERTHAATSHS